MAPESERRYEYEHQLSRANAVGDYASIIREIVSGSSDPSSRHLRPIRQFLSQKKTDWVSPLSDIGSALRELGHDRLSDQSSQKVDVLSVLDRIVTLRNKTDGHGAPTGSFYEEFASKLQAVVLQVIEKCPLFQSQWFLVRASLARSKQKWVLLNGLEPSVSEEPGSPFSGSTKNLIVVNLGARSDGGENDWIEISNLIQSDAEGRNFDVINGQWRSSQNDAELLNFYSGKSRRFEFSRFSELPAPRPKSNTAGLGELDARGEVLGNLPEIAHGYVVRPQLETELLRVLVNKQHRIIALSGIGGIGKTSLALATVDKIARNRDSPYDVVVWSSARDYDLNPDRNRSVKRVVSGVKSMAEQCGRLFDFKGTISKFSELLGDPAVGGAKSILFIVDNFETVDDPEELWKFLDQHCQHPNKVLLTTRMKSWKGDYPIEVLGMEYVESERLINEDSLRLGISEIVDEVPSYKKSLHENTSGHPHAMRMLLHEVSINRKATPPKTRLRNLGDRSLDLLFDRSFETFSADARRVFLCVCGWRSAIPEIGLEAVLGSRGCNVASALEECIRSSLLTRADRYGLESTVNMESSLVRGYGERKLKTAEDRLELELDIESLQAFPVRRGSDPVAIKGWVEEYVESCIRRVDGGETPEKFDAILESIANHSPLAWPQVVRFRKKTEGDPSKIYEALERQVQAGIDESRELWQDLASFSEKAGAPPSAKISHLVQAAKASADDVVFLGKAAQQINDFLYKQRDEIPAVRRGIFTKTLCGLMEAKVEDFNATSLSRLAWLYIHAEGDEGSENAFRCAKLGLSKEPENSHCQKIINNLKSRGFREPLD